MDDFEFSLAARTTIPLQKVVDAIDSSPGELDMESNAIKIAIEQIDELINEASATGEVTQHLKALNPIMFSNDNGWRDIFFALKKDRSSDSSKYKQIALKGYLQYLSNRKQMIATLKAKVDPQSDVDEVNAEAPSFRTGELEYEEKYDSRPLADELGMETLEQGVPVILEVSEGDEIRLLLASYQCKLVVKEEIVFIDHCNVEHSLSAGENRIGRSSDCKVRFVDSMQRISRLHLLIDIKDNNTLEFTDRSSYGTHYLKE